MWNLFGFTCTLMNFTNNKIGLLHYVLFEILSMNIELSVNKLIACSM